MSRKSVVACYSEALQKIKVSIAYGTLLAFSFVLITEVEHISKNTRSIQCIKMHPTVVGVVDCVDALNRTKTQQQTKNTPFL